MKCLWKQITAWTMLLALLVSFAPMLPMEAEAGGVIPGELATVDAGQELTIETQGVGTYEVTNMVFQSVGNTIATIQGFDSSGEPIMDENICDDDYFEQQSNILGGYRFEIKVLYGQIKVTFNTVGADDPICTYYEFGEKLDWLVKPTINEVYLTVGDTAVLNVSEVTPGFSARANDYEDDYNTIARVSEDGTITARAPGTVTVYMQVLFWRTSTQYFYFWVPCVVHVVEDYTLGAYRDFYYAEPNQAYFNIVAYRPDGMRDTGFDVTVGDQTYNTGNRTNVLVDMPANFDGSVTISKEGYVPYVLTNDHLEVNNVITMTPDQGADPVVQAVWIRRETDTSYVNAKYQTIQVIEGKSTQYHISYDAFWNGHGASAVYLQQGSMTLPLSTQGDTVALGEFFTADGGPIMLHALTTDGYVVSVPLLINMAAEVTIMPMDFGERVGTTVDKSVNGLGGQAVVYDLLNTVPVKFSIAPDGTVRGLIGLKFSGSSDSDEDIYDIYEEINQTIKQMETADKNGDKETANALMKDLQDQIAGRDAFLNPQSVNFGFDAEASFLGYFDGKMTAEGFDVTEVGMIGIFKVSGTGQQNFYIGGVPAQWRLTFADELELLICGLAEGSGGQLSFKVPEFTNTISATGALSVGAPGMVDVAATLSGDFAFDYPREAESFADGTWSMSVNFNIAANVLCANMDLLEWDSVDGMKIWPKSTQDGNSLPGTLMPAAVSLPGINIQDAVERALEEAAAFRLDIRSDSVPQFVRLADMDVMVWLEDLDTRAEGDKACLYYAVRSQETDTWSEPAPVYDDGSPDSAPRLMLVGDELYVTWQKSFGSLAGLTETADILNSLDIYVARFDAAAGTFQDAQMVHDPDDAMDLLPQLQSINGGLEAVWVRVNGDPTDPEASAFIIRSVSSQEDGWLARSVAEVPGIPDSLAFGGDGTIYYTLKGRLYSVTDGAAVAETSETAYARAAKFCEGTLYWLEDDCVTDGTERIAADGSTGDFALHISPDGKKKALAFYAANETGRQLFITYGNETGWGEPMAVTDEAGIWLSGLNGCYDDAGQLLVAANRLKTYSGSGERVAYLRLVTVGPRVDLAVTGVDYLGTSMTEGGNLLTNVMMTNSGNLPADTVAVRILEGETVLLNTAVRVGLLPGQSGNAQVIVPMDIATREGIVVTVLPVDGTDEDLTDNSADLALNPGDISAEYMLLDTQPDGTVHVAAMLINRGMTDLADISVVFTRDTPDGEVLATLDAGDAAVGQVLQISQELSGLAEGNLVYMTARLEVEENYLSNNTAFALVQPMLQETCVVQSTGNVTQENLRQDTDYTFTLGRDEETGDFEKVSGTFIPEESGFYLVYVDAHTAVGEGGSFGCTVREVDGPYSHPRWLKEEETGQWTEDWEFHGILSVYLEAGKTYAIELYGNDGSVVQLRLEKAPLPTSIQISDHTLSLGTADDNLYDMGCVTFLPELSRDLLSFSSDRQDVVRVDEAGSIITYAPGTAVITATGQLTGLETTFTITVLEPEKGTPLTVGQQYVDGEEAACHILTVPQTGYYRFDMSEEMIFRLLKGREYHYMDSESGAVLLEAGVEYYTFFESFGSLTIRKLEPQDIAMGDYVECDCADCAGVMLYRYVPEENTALNLWFAGEYCSLMVYDENYKLLSSAQRTSFHYGSSNLAMRAEAGKTYYIALEHDSNAALELSEESMELYYYSPVFVGETIELEPWFEYGNADDIPLTWSSSNESVARVKQDGTVEFLKAGEVTITVTAMDGLLTASRTFYPIAPQPIELDKPLSVTLDGQRITAVRLVFTPEAGGDYVYTVRYQTAGDSYWYYEYGLTDENGENLELLNSENVQGGNVTSLHLEAGQVCVLTLYYEAYGEDTRIDLTFLVSRVKCDVSGHSYVPGNGWEPDCENTGMTDGEHCQICGHVRVAQQEIPALGHDYVNGICSRCGAEQDDSQEPVADSVLRLAGAHRWATSLMVADEMKANLGVEKFESIIIASGNDFADALAGSYLSTVKNAPILLAWGKGGKFEYLDTDNIDYIKANLAEGGTVYILGGVNAVPELYENELKGYKVVRLGGANRFETNLLILAEAGVNEGDEILVCTSTNFADSLSASATGKPILLVFNELGKLYGKQPEYLASLKNCTFTVIGGESAVSADLAKAIETYGKVERLAGANRFETSVLVAEEYFDEPTTAVLAYAWNYPDGLCGGSLAFSMDAPLILTMTKYEAKAVEYATEIGIETGIVLGGDTLISDDAVRAIFAMETADEIIVKK